MAQKRIDITSADTKQIGFEYQYLYFIARLLQLSPGDEVGYEALDDVHVISSTNKSIFRLSCWNTSLRRHGYTASIHI